MNRSTTPRRSDGDEIWTNPRQRHLFLPPHSSTAIRVLAIDDEPSIRDVYRTALTRKGAVVDLASNGREALHRMMMQSYDVLIVDIRMAEMSGIVFL